MALFLESAIVGTVVYCFNMVVDFAMNVPRASMASLTGIQSQFKLINFEFLLHHKFIKKSILNNYF